MAADGVDAPGRWLIVDDDELELQQGDFVPLAMSVAGPKSGRRTGKVFS